MQIQAFVRKSNLMLLDATVPKYHQKRKLVAQKFESDFFATPGGFQIRISVMCTAKANELRVESEKGSLLWIWHFSPTSEMRLLLPNNEELTLIFGDTAS